MKMSAPSLALLLLALAATSPVLRAGDPEPLAGMKPAKLAKVLNPPLAGNVIDSSNRAASKLTLLGLSSDDATATGEEIMKAVDRLEELRGKSIENQPRNLTEPLTIPALEPKVVKEAIAAIAFPKTVPQEKCDTIRQVLMLQLEPGLCHPATATFSLVPEEGRFPDPGPHVGIIVAETLPDGSTAGFGAGLVDPAAAQGSAETFHWKYAYLTTPDLLSLQKDLRRDYEAKVKAREEEEQKKMKAASEGR